MKQFITMAACCLAITACSSAKVTAKGDFVAECMANGNAENTCTCAAEFAADVFTPDQLQFYRAVSFNNEKDLAEYKAKLGLIKATSLIARTGMVDADVKNACGNF